MAVWTWAAVWLSAMMTRRILWPASGHGRPSLGRSVVLSTCSIFRTRASVGDMFLQIDSVENAIGRYC